MNAKIKLGAYAVLLVLAAWFAWGFFSCYKTTTRQAAEAASAESASAIATNPPEGTNNSDTSSNNAAAPTNSAAATPAKAAAAPPPPAHGVQGTMIAYLAAFIGSIIGLGILIAHDVTQYLGNAAVDALLDDKGEGLRDPEYEKAEQVWANGKHLEAIQMMRDFLKKHPREQYAAMRIAEIYEKDLNNPLAAALEYEELLKKKLPPERWGWAAIHLCNLHSKLGQQDKTRALLQRIVDEYPLTAAAKKARSKLGLPEVAVPAPAVAEPPGAPEEVVEGVERYDLTAEVQSEAELPEAPPEPPPKPNLPSGFRPKK
jgi:TolA-binding protein